MVAEPLGLAGSTRFGVNQKKLYRARLKERGGGFFQKMLERLPGMGPYALGQQEGSSWKVDLTYALGEVGCEKISTGGWAGNETRELTDDQEIELRERKGRESAERFKLEHERNGNG